MEDIKKLLHKSKNKDYFLDNYLDIYNKRNCSKKNIKNLNILLLNTPCEGFGDIIFARKIANYLREWYNCNVYIATTKPDQILQLGEKEKFVLRLKSQHKSIGFEMCRRFAMLSLENLERKKVKKEFDLYFVAPLGEQLEINYTDVKKLIPNSNKLNTYFFSEYNNSTWKKDKYDFLTGVGKNKLGLLLTKPPKTKKIIKGKYALVYIANQNEVEGLPKRCFFNFAEMVSKKHKKTKKFRIICPNWIIENILGNPSKLSIFKKYFSSVEIIDKDKNKSEYITNSINKRNNKLIIDGSLFPVSNEKMLNFMKYSVRDILVTGDQSITDVLSCGRKKNIFYQIAPWKEDFAKQLAIHLPNKYLRTKKSACGTLEAITYESNYTDFKKKYDFRKNAKKKINNIVCSILYKNKDKNVDTFLNEFTKTKRIDFLKKKYN